MSVTETKVKPGPDRGPRPYSQETVAYVGNLTRAPELRYTQKGQALVECDLAVNPRPGEERPTEFFRLLVFGNLAENMAESDLTKSSRVVVIGALVRENWTDEAGEAKSRNKIFVHAIGPDVRYATVNVNRIFRTNAPTDGAST
jgi:single-strand DNA-binding protein